MATQLLYLQITRCTEYNSSVIGHELYLRAHGKQRYDQTILITNLDIYVWHPNSYLMHYIPVLFMIIMEVTLFTIIVHFTAIMTTTITTTTIIIMVRFTTATSILSTTSLLLLTVASIIKIVLHWRSKKNTNNENNGKVLMVVHSCVVDLKLVVVMHVFWLEAVCLFVEARCHFMIVIAMMAQGIISAIGERTTIVMVILEIPVIAWLYTIIPCTVTH